MLKQGATLDSVDVKIQQDSDGALEMDAPFHYWHDAIDSPNHRMQSSYLSHVELHAVDYRPGPLGGSS